MKGTVRLKAKLIGPRPGVSGVHMYLTSVTPFAASQSISDSTYLALSANL